MTHTKKLILVFAGMFVLMTAGGIILAYLNNMPIKYEEQLAEGFYYGAIAFAVYHMFTRNKQIREGKAKQAEAAPEPADEPAEPVETTETLENTAETGIETPPEKNAV